MRSHLDLDFSELRKQAKLSIALIPDQAILRVICRTPINRSSMEDKTHRKRIEQFLNDIDN